MIGAVEVLILLVVAVVVVLALAWLVGRVVTPVFRAGERRSRRRS